MNIIAKRDGSPLSESEAKHVIQMINQHDKVLVTLENLLIETNQHAIGKCANLIKVCEAARKIIAEAKEGAR